MEKCFGKEGTIKLFRYIIIYAEYFCCRYFWKILRCFHFISKSYCSEKKLTVEYKKREKFTHLQELKRSQLYWKNKIINPKRVVYTTITGNYDFLIIHKFLDVYSDYICFTDNYELLNKKRIGPWVIKPLIFNCLDNTRNARWHKIHAAELFFNYEVSIWIDGNVDILNDALFIEFDNLYNEGSVLSIPLHYERDCVYEECDACIQECKDNRDIIEVQKSILKERHYPQHYGLHETFIIYRKHHDEYVKKIMSDWWFWVKNYSKRDQLGFDVSLWQNNFHIPSLSGGALRFRDELVSFVSHER